MREPDEQRFLKDVAEHRINVLRDDGIYRHIQFRKPGTYCMGFDLVTWPGYLAYSGDMGEFMFTRLTDMFEFFREKPRDRGGLYINPSYWGEKCRAGVVQEYDAERFIDAVQSRLDDMDASPELREAASDVIACAHDGEYEAHRAARDFEHDGQEVFPDFWECNLRGYTYRFIWCCYALAWGIREYDALKQPQAA